MNKLKQIEALVEEAFIKLGIVTRNTNEKKILIDFGRKCAEIDEEDWEDSSRTWIGDTIKTYNSRLLGDEKKEVKQEESTDPSTPQPLKADDPRVLINGLPVKVDFRIVAEDYYQKHFVGQPALQPPLELEDIKQQLESERISHAGCGVAALGYFDGCDPKYLSASLMDVITLRKKYEELLKNQPPREWWMDLEKGDKFMYGNGVDGEIRTFNGHYSCIEDNYFLYSMEEGDSIGIGVGNCSPYTDPTQSFRDKLSPELQQEFDKLTIK